MERNTINQIIRLLKKEVVPAIGCTEPVAVALASARATELLEAKPDRIDVFLSANVLKNAMGVGIPGTGMVGLPIAIALGALIGKSAYGLEVLRDLTPEAVEEGRKMIADKMIFVSLKENVDKLYIEVVCSNKSVSAKAIISHGHTQFVYLEKEGVVLLDSTSAVCKPDENGEETDFRLSFATVYEFAMTVPLEDIRFILDAARLNKKAAEEASKHEYGHSVGRIVTGTYGKKYMGDTSLTRMLAMTSSACDVRMDGAMVPVMSNSGSGNQGIAATLPVLSFAEDVQCTEEQLIRSLMLSHLMVVYIKQSLGRLSALCGCVVAATGASCGITYLMGGNREQVSYAVKNMIGNLTGMICDGAKPSCAMKVSSGVSTAMLSALMAMENKVVTDIEGIIDEDVDNTISNLTRIGSIGMETTDKMVLEIMTGKKQNTSTEKKNY
ncbi:L-cysteine desulfidase family protein [Massilibacteroides vaginae]|uniref:L-cysteine desulfidase family protein n=1 Tax=Massilibacteroides vaginae TaxID=1673718 RepID=UPI000A1C9B8B|nr:L-serine ammonia-lyase, iron-sulfur-dependent, subunit alpha [Massilibacteroides vaginae]